MIFSLNLGACSLASEQAIVVMRGDARRRGVMCGSAERCEEEPIYGSNLLLVGRRLEP
ncbi:hypothetical protein Gbfr_022_042 [Gluconobacter frateurii M-2]|nr:hypothetical protein Gbfr_022_042 [Gluconobacter frateurii M-2]